MASGPRYEEELRAPVRAHFEAQGYDVRDEVRFNGRVADLVAVRGGDVVAVELKLTDWKGAHVQAKAYQVGARRSYVAVPLQRALKLEERLARFEESGVGLLGVAWPSGDVRELARARPSDRYLPFLGEALAEGRLQRRRRGRWWRRGR